MARDDASESRQVEQPLAEPTATAREAGPRGNGLGPAAAGGAPRKADDAEHVRQAIAQLERENRRLRKRCEEAELEINHLERSLKNTENTLSFRLGYALIHSTKSLNALRSLPSALLELSRDSRRRQGHPPTSLVRAALRVARDGLRRHKGERQAEDSAEAAGSRRDQ